MLDTKESNGVLIVKFNVTDRFNALIAEPVKESLLAYFSKAGTKLILDLEGIKFIDSTGFSVFLSTMKAASNSNGQFKICNVSDDVKELFHVLQLHNIFEIYDTVDECLATF